MYVYVSMSKYIYHGKVSRITMLTPDRNGKKRMSMASDILPGYQYSPKLHTMLRRPGNIWGGKKKKKKKQRDRIKQEKRENISTHAPLALTPKGDGDAMLEESAD